MLQEAGQIKELVVLIFTFTLILHIQRLHLMLSEVVWVLVSSVTQVLLQLLLDLDYIPDYLYISHDYDIDNYFSDDFRLCTLMPQTAYLEISMPAQLLKMSFQ